MPRPMARSRRTCHAVPGSSERFIAKAPQLEADEVFLDLEDAVAPDEKDERARARDRGAARRSTSAARPWSCASTGRTRRTTTAT